MRMSVHLNFQGNCAEAFAFYTKVFKAANLFQVTYGDAPTGSPLPPDWSGKVMHASIPVGDGLTYYASANNKVYSITYKWHRSLRCVKCLIEGTNMLILLIILELVICQLDGLILPMEEIFGYLEATATQ